jgi:hypothetical protein
MWIEALIAVNAEIVACERRFHRQCIRIVDLTTKRQDTAEDELLLASYMTSLTLVRAHRDGLLADAPTDT